MALTIGIGTDTMDWQLSKESVLDRIQTLFKTSQWSDCTFRVEGQTDMQVFKAHKLILASCSPVFEAMCFGPLAEKKCVRVPDMEPDVFRILLEYIYTDSVKLSSIEEAGGVLYASKKYMLPHLSRTCHDYLLSNLRPSNVLAVFEFAEEIQEDKLLESCIDVMCKHTEEVLSSPGCHISSFTLATLLEQGSLNIGEAQLFDAALHWAQHECQQLGLQPTIDNRRSLLSKAGALSKIRFLSLSPQEFADGPERSGILTADEIHALRYAILDVHSNNPSEEIIRVNYSATKLPPGWCSLMQPRGRISIKKFYCSRRFLKTAVTVSGHLRLLTKVQVDKSVMVSGVRVFTRLVPQTDFTFAPHFPRMYKENMEVSVLDYQGILLCRTVFCGLVEYNTLTTVTLSEPVRFNSNKEYSILLVLPSSGGQIHEYPLSFMSQTETSRGIEFRFCDHADIDGNGAFVRRLDMAFLDAIVYSI